jgi:hypothetical protein
VLVRVCVFDGIHKLKVYVYVCVMVNKNSMVCVPVCVCVCDGIQKPVLTMAFLKGVCVHVCVYVCICVRNNYFLTK